MINNAITVAIVSYRYGHLLSHAIESVLSQTRQPEDMVVVDDGAHDGVGTICNKYSVRCVEREQNIGIIKNFNDILFNQIHTGRVLFLGADNYLRPDCLELLAKENADIVSYDLYLFGTQSKQFADLLIKDGKEVIEENGYLRWKFTGGNIHASNHIHGSALYNTALAKAVGGYEQLGIDRPNEDHALWKKMVLAGASHKHIEAPLMYYRRHGDNFLKYESEK